MDHSTVVNPNVCYVIWGKLERIKLNCLLYLDKETHQKLINILQWTSYSEWLLLYSAWYVSYAWLSLYLLYLLFIQQQCKNLSLFYVKWCIGWWVMDWKGRYCPLNWGTVLIFTWRKFLKGVELNFLSHVSSTAKMIDLQYLQFSPAVSDGSCYWMQITKSVIFCFEFANSVKNLIIMCKHFGQCALPLIKLLHIYIWFTINISSSS